MRQIAQFIRVAARSVFVNIYCAWGAIRQSGRIPASQNRFDESEMRKVAVPTNTELGRCLPSTHRPLTPSTVCREME